MVIEFNKTYEFYIDSVSFADLTKEELATLFSDGRVASHFIEIQITKWFPELQRKEIKRGRAKSDHIGQNNVIYEMKNFTKYGCKLMPSYMYGGSRKFNFDEYNKLAKDTKYIVCDIRNFPIIKIIFKDGTDIVNLFPKGLADKNQDGLLYA
jgi:hypothetical protein